MKLIKKTWFILLPLLLTAAMVGLKLIRFGTVDDVMLYDMVTSYPTNAHSEQVFFISVIFGYVLKLLYGILPAVNWFGVLYLAGYNLAFITLFKILEKHGSNLAFISVLSGLHIYFLMRISFTTNAYLLVFTGVLWAFDTVEKLDKKGIGNLFFALLLFLFGFGMRRDAIFYCIILLFVPLFVISVIKKRKSVAVLLTVLVLMTVSNFGLNAVQEVYKSHIPAETYYSEFQPYRSEASDGGNISYADNKALFKEAGLSKNDIRLFRKYIYGDKTVYSGEALKSIIKSRSFKNKYNTNVLNILARIVQADEPVLNYFFYLAAAVILLMILYKNKRWELLASSVFIAGAELYLFLRRRGVTRVTFPLAMLGILLLIYQVLEEENPFLSWKLKVNPKRLSQVVCCIVLIGTVLLSALSVKTYQTRFKSYDQVVEAVESDSEHVYLSVPQTRDLMMDRHLTLLSKTYDTLPVYVVAGDWYIYTYYYYDLLERLGLSEYKDNAMNAFLDERVRVVCKDKDIPSQFVRFYRQHYGIKANYHVLEEFEGGMKIYEFRIEE